jgi:hypothetical protein
MFSRRHILRTASAAAGFMTLSPAALAQAAVIPTAQDNMFIWGRKLRKVADKRVIHRFFDTSPISPSGRFIALIRFGDESRSVRPGDVSDIVLVDLKSGQERVIAQTHGFELQLGAQVQWGSTDKELFFADVDIATWKSRTILINPRTGKRRELDGPLFMVSPDGKQICGHDMTTARFAQVGYGVVVPDDKAPRVVGPSATNGVYVTDVSSGKSRLVATSAAIFAVLSLLVPIERPQSYEFYVFQVKWNPQGTRLMISYQWAPVGGGDRRRAVLTMLPDGSDIRVALRPEQWARGGHHICWMADGEHISMNLNVDEEPGIELVSFKYDGTELKTIYDPGSGHPSQHPKGLPLIVTDAYPGEPVTTKPGTVPIRLINLRTQTEMNVAEVYVSTQGGEFRIDPHPAWDRSGRYVVFNGYVGGTRNVWMIDLGDLVDAETAYGAHKNAKVKRTVS